ncbi:endonuclease/exonuclease/phosphatase [Purpureocillium lavendulum]|uniref:Endonuclease/exonuclease/phosphatase n=1 Tax=Purpureocillium lavendulum TaxID=1247861 RepID=A0AB34FEF9_9HYPO|nr:endonuclease/exonuclease/phosphatase [Purpureocillium lavendulum]
MKTMSNGDIAHRLQRLEQAVFDVSSASPSIALARNEAPLPISDSSHTPFGLHLRSAPASRDGDVEAAAYARRIATKLPPLAQARELFHHFAQKCQPNWGVLHIPSARALLERTYDSLEGSEPVDVADLLLLFSVFAAAAFSWTSSLLSRLSSTPAEARAAFAAYNRLALSILENDVSPVKPSTTALAALSNLAHLGTNSRGLSDNVLCLRLKCLVMARSMGVDRLDTRKSREGRSQDTKGCNMVELEVQRRVWWNLVGFDWLSACPGSPHEGTYLLQPRHMNVKLPCNAFDEHITADKAPDDLPLCVPTPMGAFIYRVKLAEVCRKAVDALPSALHDSEDVDYDVVLQLDTEFNKFLHDLPWYFRLDEADTQRVIDADKQQPMLAVHRVGINFSAQTRLCRLHRPYHLLLEGRPSADPPRRCAYSQTACVRAAHTVLELRRQMDDIGARVGIRPARSWIVMQHVFIAALILATDVSRDPDGAGADDARRAKVLAACQMLERSTEESGAVMQGVQKNLQGVQKNLQALMATLRERQQLPSMEKASQSSAGRMPNIQAGRTEVGVMAVEEGVGVDTGVVPPPEAMQGVNEMPTVDDQNWDVLWTEFLQVAPELDVPQWDLLLDDLELPSLAP